MYKTSKKYLPIGTVVLLKNANKPLMIYGIKQKLSNENSIYDYRACFYPEGHISDDFQCYFNQLDIDKVLFKGYENK